MNREQKIDYLKHRLPDRDISTWQRMSQEAIDATYFVEKNREHKEKGI